MTEKIATVFFLFDLNSPTYAGLLDVLAHQQRTGKWPPIPPEPVMLPVVAPLWRGTVVTAGLAMRDAEGNLIRSMDAGEAVAVYGEGGTAGEYKNRLIITPPGGLARNVFAPGVKKLP